VHANGSGGDAEFGGHLQSAHAQFDDHAIDLALPFGQLADTAGELIARIVSECADSQEEGAKADGPRTHAAEQTTTPAALLPAPPTPAQPAALLPAHPLTNPTRVPERTGGRTGLAGGRAVG
jgi:hypothetical protein